jgi:hypothetical protein
VLSGGRASRQRFGGVCGRRANSITVRLTSPLW